MTRAASPHLDGGTGGDGTIGPYRIEHRLGRGGMGEVYAGYDDRLDRPVALKRIGPGAAADPLARRRFRREARILSRLHHPAIVPVFDWVETDSGDWLVMQLVPGRSLRSLLSDGPLEPIRAARRVQDVLAGLAAAHGAGVLHRDLKPENVMVTTAGPEGSEEQARILDFGLARHLGSDGGESQAESGEGLAGTLTALSPEQVRGHPLDARSDLFAVGSLFYETLTRRSPFRGGSPAETLQRICTGEPPLAHFLQPTVPQALSLYVARLLEKDPRRRPPTAAAARAELDRILREAPAAVGTGWTGAESPTRTAEETIAPWRAAGAALPGAVSTGGISRRRGRRLGIAAGVAALVGITLVIFGRPPAPLYVAVPAIRIEAPEEAVGDLSLTAGAVRTAILRGLLGLRGVVALEPSTGTDPDPSDAVALAQTLAADEVLTSRLECDHRRCRLELRRVPGAGGPLVWTADFAVDPDRLLDTSRAVIEHLRHAYAERRLRPGIPDLEVRAQDYAAYLRLRQRFDQREAGFSADTLVTALEDLERTSPRFLDLPLFAASALLRRFDETRQEGDLERAREALEQARRLAPEDPRVLAQEAYEARVTGRLEDAEAALDRLRRMEPGNALTLHQQAQLLERQGRAGEALERMAEVVRQLPSAGSYFNLGRMLYRQGDIAAARRAIESGLARSPGHYNGLSLLAQLELAGGDLRRATELYEQLLERSREVPELTNLGTALLLMGRYEDAAERFREALELSPASPFTLLNLADALLLADRRREALELYRRLLEQMDRAPRSERLLTVQAQALARLGRAPEAVAAIQEALRLAPDSPHESYEAALVFILVGDETSALWNAQRAMAGGFDRRWFDFPWFDPLRPRLREIPPTPPPPS